MIVVNLAVALGLLGGLWVALARALAASARRDDLAQEAPARLAAKGAPWRSLPANRVLPILPTPSGPANESTTAARSRLKNLPA